MRLVPAPLTSLALFATWLALARSTSAGTLVLAAVLALGIPLLTGNVRPANVRVRRPLVIVRYVLRVGADVLRSNFQVAWGVLRWRWRPRSTFVVVPLDLRDPVGLAALAMVTSVVPGTVWSELAVDRSALLLHVWHVPEVTGEAAFVAAFKERYEKPLREIFE